MKNAVITHATLSVEDHGCLSSFLTLEFEGGGQGFGGYMLFSPRGKSEVAGLWIWRILETLEVGRWENLRGTNLRFVGTSSGIEGIGHIIKDKWFYPAKEFKEREEKCL